MEGFLLSFIGAGFKLSKFWSFMGVAGFMASSFHWFRIQFGHYFRAILASFWRHFGSILRPADHLRDHFGIILSLGGPLGEHFGSLDGFGGSLG